MKKTNISDLPAVTQYEADLAQFDQVELALVKYHIRNPLVTINREVFCKLVDLKLYGEYNG